MWCPPRVTRCQASREPQGLGLHTLWGHFRPRLALGVFALAGNSQPCQKERGHSDTGNFLSDCLFRLVPVGALMGRCTGTVATPSVSAQEYNQGHSQKWPHKSHLPSSIVICSALHQCSGIEAQTWLTRGILVVFTPE